MSGMSTHQRFAILETSQRGMSLMAHDSYEELTRSAVYACIMRSTPGSEHEVVKMLRDTIHDAVTDLHEESHEGEEG